MQCNQHLLMGTAVMLFNDRLPVSELKQNITTLQRGASQSSDNYLELVQGSFFKDVSLKVKNEP
jgi:hypothetical protein